MKKYLLLLLTLFIGALQTFADELPKAPDAPVDNITLLTQKGFFSTSKPLSSLGAYDEIRKTFCLHIKYSNTYNFDNLKNLYAPNYVNSDGLSREIYFDLVKKTWESYPDIKYRIEIKNIEVNDNVAVVQVHELADATTGSKSGIIEDKGYLQSVSDSVYYLEKIDNQWLVTSDYILFEKTSLKYGSAKDMEINLSSPAQIPAGTPYTATLKITPPKDSFVIASVGQENITYPQTSAAEVFRKLPEDGILERMFTSNSKNLNEYSVASFGVTKAEIKDGREIKIYVTGLGFTMNRINVIPKRDEIKVSENGQSK